jgi:hypothetical protein
MTVRSVLRSRRAPPCARRRPSQAAPATRVSRRWAPFSTEALRAHERSPAGRRGRALHRHLDAHAPPGTAHPRAGPREPHLNGIRARAEQRLEPLGDHPPARAGRMTASPGPEALTRSTTRLSRAVVCGYVPSFGRSCVRRRRGRLMSAGTHTSGAGNRLRSSVCPTPGGGPSRVCSRHGQSSPKCWTCRQPRRDGHRYSRPDPAEW